MSQVTVVIPLRGVHGGKSRLASLLNPVQRANAIAAMADHVLEAVLASGVAATVLVVTREVDMRRHLRIAPGQVDYILQPDEVVGLNGAIDLGRRRALEGAASRMMVLLADLPCLSAHDVRAFAESDADVSIGTDEAHTGTNALLLNSRSVMTGFQFHFGANSRFHHQVEAARRGLVFETAVLDGIARDLDTPEDWAMLTGDEVHRLVAPRSPGIPVSSIVTDQESAAILEHA